MERAYENPEDEYVHSPNWISIRRLAAKWEVSFNYLRHRAWVEGWTKKRQKFLSELTQKRSEVLIEREVTKLEQIDNQADPLYEATLSIVGARLTEIARALGEGQPAADVVDARELDGLLTAVVKAHTQRRLIHGGITSRVATVAEEVAKEFGVPIEDLYAEITDLLAQNERPPAAP